MREAHSSFGRPVVVTAALALAANRLMEHSAGRGALDYIAQQRRVSRQVLAQFQVGYYQPRELVSALGAQGFTAEDIGRSGMIRESFDGWLVFPWLNDAAALRGLVFRTIPGTTGAKDRLGRPLRYAFCGDRDRLPLYGLASAIASPAPDGRGGKHLLVVEGTIDALALRSAGFSDVVAINSCQLRVWHAADLKQRGIDRVTICLDGDVPGQRGVIAAIEAASAVGLRVTVAAPLPEETDPDEFVAQAGAGALRAHLAEAEDGFAYYVRHLERETAGLAPSERQAVIIEGGVRFHTLRAPGRDDSDLQASFWPLIRAATGVTPADADRMVGEAYQRLIALRAQRGLPAVA